MRLAALALALHDPADERHGEWSKEQLLENERTLRCSTRAGV
jgi:hypothetical protein